MTVCRTTCSIGVQVIIYSNGVVDEHLNDRHDQCSSVAAFAAALFRQVIAIISKAEMSSIKFISADDYQNN